MLRINMRNKVISNGNRIFLILSREICMKWPPLTRQPEDKLSSNMAG